MNCADIEQYRSLDRTRVRLLNDLIPTQETFIFWHYNDPLVEFIVHD